ncbi:hypothetical protein BTN50_0865 [Candidatus Enterovibrio altilux]|uniref:Uncharacterized protein n=1 Tax=Candidatus Enterovibrio altilux TaxID=1927128 RepID=A0A291B8R4_9GAMM|nr:hypothetical protein BTN50_0865 [Candidatus Enterovibrio luxaltus]
MLLSLKYYNTKINKACEIVKVLNKLAELGMPNITAIIS